MKVVSEFWYSKYKLGFKLFFSITSAKSKKNPYTYTTLNIGFLTNLKNLVYVFAIFHPTLMSIEALSLY